MTLRNLYRVRKTPLRTGTIDILNSKGKPPITFPNQFTAKPTTSPPRSYTNYKWFFTGPKTGPKIEKEMKKKKPPRTDKNNRNRAPSPPFNRSFNRFTNQLHKSPQNLNYKNLIKAKSEELSRERKAKSNMMLFLLSHALTSTRKGHNKGHNKGHKRKSEQKNEYETNSNKRYRKVYIPKATQPSRPTAMNATTQSSRPTAANADTQTNILISKPKASFTTSANTQTNLPTLPTTANVNAQTNLPTLPTTANVNAQTNLATNANAPTFFYRLLKKRNIIMFFLTICVIIAVVLILHFLGP